MLRQALIGLKNGSTLRQQMLIMKQKHLLGFFQLLLSGLILYVPFACTHIYYHPNMHNVPMLREKGDIRANVALSQGNEVEATELQAAYAVKNNVGVMLNFIGGQASGGRKNGRGGYLEGGAGYFKPLGTHFVFESYGGFGAGSIANFRAYTEVKPFFPIYFGKAFVQPSIGFHSKIVDAAFSCRVGGVYYFPYAAPDSAHLYGLQGALAVENKAFLYAEPAITLRGGYKYLKLQAQLGLNYMDLPASRSSANFNVGLYGDISEMAKAWRKK